MQNMQAASPRKEKFLKRLKAEGGVDNFKQCPPHWELNAVEVDLHLSLSNNNNNNNNPLPLTMHFSLQRTGLNWCVSQPELQTLHLQLAIRQLLSLSLAFYCNLIALH